MNERGNIQYSNNFIHLLKRQHNYTPKNESENLTNQQHKTLRSVVVVRSKAINHLHLAMVLMSTVGLSSLFPFISRTHLAYDVSTNLELAS